MSEVKQFVGQPVLSQILSCIPSAIINKASRKHNSNRYYKKIPARVHLVSLLYGVFSYCNGLRELCEGMWPARASLLILVLTKPLPAVLCQMPTPGAAICFLKRFTLNCLLNITALFRTGRLKGLSIRNLKIIDSTTIRLFSDILRGVGRNTKDGSRKKGGIKVHTLMDAFSGVAEFVRMTEAKVHDRKFLYHIDLAANSFIVFDKAYNHYSQFAKWTTKKIWFVACMKDKSVYHVTKVITDKTKKKNAKGVLKDLLHYRRI